MPSLRRPARLLGVVAALPVATLLGCGGDGPTKPELPGPPVALDVVSGNLQGALAGTVLGKPVILKVRDAKGRGVPGQAVTFRLEGAGKLADTTATTGADGTVNVPGWTLGTSAGSYAVTASSGSFSVRLSANATSDFPLDVRFFGSSVAGDQQALFTAAAARIRGVVTGAVPSVNIPNFDLASSCGVKGLPVVNELVPGMIVFAAVDSIDGKGKTLAQAGGCLLRKFVVAGDSVQLPLVGIMMFDRDDWATMIAQGNLQDVITHEMLHLVGVGRSMWVPKKLLRDEGLSTVAFTGARAIKGCQDANGAVFCGSSVPVENTGGSGTAGTHWRETTFGSELMTGFADRCPPAPQPCRYPLSGITVGALQDIGYTVNFAAVDSYSLPLGAQARMMNAETPVEWEQALPTATWEVLPSGARRRIKPAP